MVQGAFPQPNLGCRERCQKTSLDFASPRPVSSVYLHHRPGEDVGPLEDVASHPTKALVEISKLASATIESSHISLLNAGEEIEGRTVTVQQMERRRGLDLSSSCRLQRGGEEEESLMKSTGTLVMGWESHHERRRSMVRRAKRALHAGSARLTTTSTCPSRLLPFSSACSSRFVCGRASRSSDLLDPCHHNVSSPLHVLLLCRASFHWLPPFLYVMSIYF